MGLSGLGGSGFGPNTQAQSAAGRQSERSRAAGDQPGTRLSCSRPSPHGPSVGTSSHFLRAGHTQGRRTASPAGEAAQVTLQEERCKAASPLTTEPQKLFSDIAATRSWCTPVTSPTIFKRRGLRLPLGGKGARLLKSPWNRNYCCCHPWKVWPATGVNIKSWRPKIPG